MKAIIAGSKDGWLPKLAEALSAYGIEIVGRWDAMDDPRRKGTYGADLVLVTNDCCSHSLMQNSQTVARKAGIRCLTITHRLSANAKLLESFGFKQGGGARAEARAEATAHYKQPNHPKNPKKPHHPKNSKHPHQFP